MTEAIFIPTTASKQSQRELSNKPSLTIMRPLLVANERFLWWKSTSTTITKSAKSHPSAFRSGLRKKQPCRFVQILRRFLRRLQNCMQHSSVLPMSTSHRSLITILKRSYETALSSYQEHPQVLTPAVPPALQPPLTRLRTQSSTVTNSTAPPQPTELVQCPSVTQMRKMPLTPTSTTTFPITAPP
jgi:hypothetical protein